MNMIRVRAQLDGFTNAADRFENALARDDAQAMFRSVFEALNWAVALDDRIKEHWAPEGKVLGWGWRSRVRGAELLVPVRWARNAVHHDWADALLLDENGFQFPMRFPLTFTEWVWRSADSLPGGQGRFGEGEYKSELEGRPVRVSIAQMREVFSTVTTFLDPPSPVRGDLQAEGT